MFKTMFKKKMPDYGKRPWKSHIRFSVRHPLLIGHYNVLECQPDGSGKFVEHRRKLRSIQDVATFICKEGVQNGNLFITTADGAPFIETFGMYLRRIEDSAYRRKLQEVLVPMQMKVDEQFPQ